MIVSDQELLDAEALRTYLDGLGLGSGPVACERIGDGHSNVTARLTRDGGEWVIRRPPAPPYPPGTHDVLREARVLRALADTPVPVPRVLAVCEEEDVLGVPFYLMERLLGEAITERVPGASGDSVQGEEIAAALADGLAAIHAVDWRAAGLADFGRPDGYLERQLRRFGRLWDGYRRDDSPDLDPIVTWLARELPDQSPPALVHGDYRLGNVLVSAADPSRLAGILDWEMSTLGDPLADVGYLAASYAGPEDEMDALSALSPVTAQPGFPPRRRLLERYEEVSGRSLAGVGWYRVLAIWKFVVVMEGNYVRAMSAGGGGFAVTVRPRIARLAELARELTSASADELLT